MAKAEVERFSLNSRILHWTVFLACAVLTVTGLFLFLPWGGSLAQDSISRVIHRIAAIVLIGSPVIYFFTNPKGSIEFLLEAFKWGKDDFEWLKHAPDYYFGGKSEKMPPQPHINTGQKMWWCVCIMCTIGFAITGLIMWISAANGSNAFFAAVLIHDLCLIIGGAMLIVHVYLGAIHPKMTESFKSMITGKISPGYARGHYGKWFEEEVRGKKE